MFVTVFIFHINIYLYIINIILDISIYGLKNTRQKPAVEKAVLVNVGHSSKPVYWQDVKEGNNLTWFAFISLLTAYMNQMNKYNQKASLIYLSHSLYL